MLGAGRRQLLRHAASLRQAGRLRRRPRRRQLSAEVAANKPAWSTASVDVALEGVAGPLAVEYAHLQVPGADPAAPLVLGVPSSGSSYKQWGKLAPAITGLGAPGAASEIVAVNLFGSGASAPWPHGPGGPVQTLWSFQKMLEVVFGALTEEQRSRGIHLMGHSMGGGIALHSAAQSEVLRPYLKSVTVFEPNHFMLLAEALKRGEGGADLATALELTMAFVDGMIECGETDDWSLWGPLFQDFWFDGNWDAVPEKFKEVLLSTIPHTFHEIKSIRLAEAMAGSTLDGLAGLGVPKRILRSPTPGIGSKPCLEQMQLVLERRGFGAEVVPEGSHMAPITHADTCMPRLAAALL